MSNKKKSTVHSQQSTEKKETLPSQEGTKSKEEDRNVMAPERQAEMVKEAFLNSDIDLDDLIYILEDYQELKGAQVSIMKKKKDWEFEASFGMKCDDFKDSIQRLIPDEEDPDN